MKRYPSARVKLVLNKEDMKYIFPGTDKEFVGMLSMLIDNNYQEAALFLSKTLVSKKVADKITYENNVEKERLEEDSFFLEENSDEELIEFYLFLKKMFEENESIQSKSNRRKGRFL